MCCKDSAFRPKKLNLCTIKSPSALIVENLLHYVWLHKLFPAAPLRTTDGRAVEVLDPGLHNLDAGPDFFNAKVKIDGTEWVGNVELHVRAADWRRHGHEADRAYANVILHVVEHDDAPAYDCTGRRLPCLVLPVPEALRRNYARLLAEEAYPPCYRIVPALPRLTVHGFLSALTAERLQAKAQRIDALARRFGGDWEQACFVTLARNFGFGTNGEAFEQWALRVPLMVAGKHRDNPLQIEALFFGQAGLLASECVPPACRAESERDGHRARLEQEYRFLAHKFSLTPIDPVLWKFGRLRPQNFPHIRLAQLAALYLSGRGSLSQIVEPVSADALRHRLATDALPYWQSHYVFGSPSPCRAKALGSASLNLLLVNTVAPMLFAYGRHRCDERLQSRALSLLEELPAEDNRIVRSWAAAGLTAAHAADSQALIELRRNYCDRKDCLRCRFGYAYLSSKHTL